MHVKLIFLHLLIFLFFNTISTAQVLEFKQEIECQSNGICVKTNSFLIQIKDQRSKELANISLPFSAGNKLDILEAQVLDMNGKVIKKLKKKEITVRSDVSYSSLHEEDYRKEFSLVNTSYPYLVKYKYSYTKDEYFYLADWYPSYRKNVKVKEASLTVKTPAAFELIIDFTDGLDYKKIDEGKNVIHQWTVTDYQLPKAEKFAPAWQETEPHVVVIPVDFQYGVKGSNRSWADFGKWVENLNAGRDELPDAEARKIDALVAGLTDKKEIIRTLYAYMQENNRYINVSIDIGGMQPYPASYVVKNRYGDCKALTNYMKAILGHVGIPAYYTLVYAGDDPVKINENIPTTQFNHVILAIPLEGDTIWLENTVSYFPIDYLGAFTHNRKVLLVDQDNSKLVKTPALTVENVADHYSYRYSLNEEGEGLLHLQAQVSGDDFSLFSYSSKKMTREEQRKMLNKKIVPANTDLEDWQFVQQDVNKSTMVLKAKFKTRKQIESAGSMDFVSVLHSDFPLLEEPEKRKRPLKINIPVNRTDTIIYNIDFQEPKGIALPKNVNITSVFGRYSEQYTADEQKVIVIRNYQLYNSAYGIDEYPDFFNFFKSIKKAQRKSAIIFEQKT